MTESGGSKSAYTGPGPNSFSASADNATVRADGSLRLAITQTGGQWRCSEVVVEDVLGYGTYRFKTRGRLDLLDPNVVFGLFLWEYADCYADEVMWWNPPNEFDIEFSRWGQRGRRLRAVRRPAVLVGWEYQPVRDAGADAVRGHQ